MTPWDPSKQVATGLFVFWACVVPLEAARLVFAVTRRLPSHHMARVGHAHQRESRKSRWARRSKEGKGRKQPYSRDIPKALRVKKQSIHSSECRCDPRPSGLLLLARSPSCHSAPCFLSDPTPQIQFSHQKRVTRLNHNPPINKL